MKEKLKQLKEEALQALSAVETASELEALRVKFLGKKGEITAILKQMGSLSAEERPVIGQLANEIRAGIEDAVGQKSEALASEGLSKQLTSEVLDVTIPGKEYTIGRRHPITIVLDEVKEIFIGMGFDIAEGPEVELSLYDFDRLNIPATHPAREWTDTFYIKEDESVHLRCQTSPVQVRVMENKQPPIRIISPGRVYRKDEVDSTHSPMFHQIEGLVVDKGVTMADLKGTLNLVVSKLYGEDCKTRFRPHHFPFTEPSCEVDVQCVVCGGAGCKTCKQSGWLELLGAGVVHPKVLAGCGIDPEVYSGFAFGIGLDRMTMLRFGIDDLRLLFENDLRFLNQF
ncbi:MAG: phenylalanine--tRNA ligase subunit alpha [Oscillospiraceae bacterium]|nr:phenylalanine--tRNA ligase subunit alpha [Oscillospiraceae bacterium]